MPKPKKIDLNQYEVVSSEDDLIGHSGLILIPKKNKDGSQPQTFYFRKPSGVVHIEDVDNSVWTKDCRISTAGSQMDYIKRVEWWFENALKDPEYREILISMYKNAVDNYGFNMKYRIEQTKGWLQSLEGSARKTYINKALMSSMNRGVTAAIRNFERTNKKEYK